MQIKPGAYKSKTGRLIIIISRQDDGLFEGFYLSVDGSPRHDTWNVDGSIYQGDVSMQETFSCVKRLNHKGHIK